MAHWLVDMTLFNLVRLAGTAGTWVIINYISAINNYQQFKFTEEGSSRVTISNLTDPKYILLIKSLCKFMVMETQMFTTDAVLISSCFPGFNDSLVSGCDNVQPCETCCNSRDLGHYQQNLKPSTITNSSELLKRDLQGFDFLIWPNRSEIYLAYKISL